MRLILAKDLVIALEQGNESVADGLLDEIAELRETHMYQEIGRLTRQVHDSLGEFTLDSKISNLTTNDLPDAKERLQYVISMTEESANQTLNVVEKLLPISQDLNSQSEQLSAKWERFLDREMPFEEFKGMSSEITKHFDGSKNSLQNVEQGLNEILMAQGFQDITGQIIKRVIDMVQDLEHSMVDLIKLSGSSGIESKSVKTPDLPGPVVPGVDDKDGDIAENQDDVDDLLSSLGF